MCNSLLAIYYTKILFFSPKTSNDLKSWVRDRVEILVIKRLKSKAKSFTNLSLQPKGGEE